MDFSQDETEKAVMGTYSHFVVPKTPRARGNIELLRTLYAIDDDDRENKLLELLHCTPEELKKGFNELLEFSPYPSENFEPELYKIWYEHVQNAAVNCFEYLDDNFPQEKEDFDKTLNKIIK